jgi:hypothetical protein
MTGDENEKDLSDYCSVDAALLGSNAIRVFSVGEVLVNNSFWSDGVSLL